MEGDAILTWLATRASAETLLLLAVVILAAVEGLKRVLARIPAWPAGFSDWWLFGGALGVALGLWQVELSLAGAAVGLVCGALATGGYEYLRRAGSVLGGAAGAGGAVTGGGPSTGLGTGAAKTLLLLLVLGAGLVLFTGGCAAPLQVREAQAFEEAAWRVYLANSDRIQGAWSAAYAEARRADLEYTTAKAIDVIKAAAAKAAAEQKALSGDEIAVGVRTVVEEREKAQAATARVQAALAALQKQNALEAAKALRLHGGMAEWLGAGVEESEIPGLVDEFLGMIRAGMGGVSTVPASAAAAAP